MQKRILFARTTALLLASALTLAACSPSAPAPTPVDPNAIFTQAAQTAFANVTLTAMAASPTPEPTATFTPIPTVATVAAIPTVGAGTPVVIPTLGGVTGVQPTSSVTDNCHKSAWVADVTVADGSIVSPGQVINKTWTIKNTGTCTWDDGYSLRYGWGTNAALSSLWGGAFWNLTGTVKPGETVDATVTLIAPNTPGTYDAVFKMMTDSNPPYFFGGALSINIIVQ